MPSHTPSLLKRAGALIKAHDPLGLLLLLHETPLPTAAAQTLVDKLECGLTHDSMDGSAHAECVIALLRTSSAVMSNPAVASHWCTLLSAQRLPALLSPPVPTPPAPVDELIAHLRRARWSPLYPWSTRLLSQMSISAPASVFIHMPIASAMDQMSDIDAASMVLMTIMGHHANARVMNAHVPGCVDWVLCSAIPSETNPTDPMDVGMVRSLFRSAAALVDLLSADTLSALRDLKDKSDQPAPAELTNQWARAELEQAATVPSIPPPAKKM